MTIKPRVQKFRIRRDAPASPQAETETVAVPPTTDDTAPALTMQDQLDAIAQEGLTARQLRMARRVAQKQGLIVGSDYDAVRQLRLAGIDPFQRHETIRYLLVSPVQVGSVPSQVTEPLDGLHVMSRAVAPCLIISVPAVGPEGTVSVSVIAPVADPQSSVW